MAATAENLLQFIDSSPTPFHAIQEMRKRLLEKGFQECFETDHWESQPNSKQFTVRSETSIAAWISGSDNPAESGFRIIGAHTDSPNLRLKPQAEISENGYHQLGVEVYGGVLLSTWTDRDLSLAGLIYIEEEGGIKAHELMLQEPILRIPQLSIHLNRDVNEKGLLLNAQKHLPPVFGLAGENQDEGFLKKYLASKIKVEPESILSYDLSLYDTQASALLGENQEFIVAPRLDNLFSCYCALESLISGRDQPFSQTRMMVCFDHEEIGSMTSQGARSSFLKNTLRRLTQGAEKHAYERSTARSILLSADMAHAVHPNYPDKHEPKHFPKINEGPVIKINAQGRYATNGWSEAVFEKMCKDRNIPVQKFVNRSDLACGSTIGPFVAGDLGIPTLDVGAAMLSMHSIREMCGSLDSDWMEKAFSGFYESEMTSS